MILLEWIKNQTITKFQSNNEIQVEENTDEERRNQIEELSKRLLVCIFNLFNYLINQFKLQKQLRNENQSQQNTNISNMNFMLGNFKYDIHIVFNINCT